MYLGYVQREVGDLEAAAETQDIAIALARANEDDWSAAWALMWRAGTATDQGHDDLAAKMLDEAWALAERNGDSHSLGWVLKEVRERRAAGRWLPPRSRSRPTRWRCSSDTRRAAVLPVRSPRTPRRSTTTGRTAEAIRLHRRAVRMATELGQPYVLVDALEALADDTDDAVATTGLHAQANSTPRPNGDRSRRSAS